MSLGKPNHALVVSNAARKRLLNHHIEDFKRGMAIFATMIGRRHDINVYYHGTTPSTDGRNIYVPELRLLVATDMSDAKLHEALEVLQMARSHVYHECAHILYTDFAAFRRAGIEYGPEFQRMVNTLEDPRIELKLGKTYAGAKMILDETNRTLESKAVAATFQTLPPIVQACNCAQYGTASLLYKKLSPEAVVLYKKHRADMDEAIHAPDINGVIAVVKRLLEAHPLPKTAKKPKRAEGAADKDALEAKPGDGSEGDGPTAAESTEANGDALGNAPASSSEALQEFLSKTLKSSVTNADPGEYRVFSTADDETSYADASNAYTKDELKARLLDLEKEIAAGVGVTKRRLEALLKSRSMSRISRGHEDGQLDQSSLHLVALAGRGDSRFREQATHVFNQTIQERSYEETVVSLSIDCSGSMLYESRYRLAMQTALMFGQVLDALNVRFEIHGWSTGFPRTHTINKWDDLDENERDLYARVGRLVIRDVKRFEDTWSASRYRIPALRPIECNYDAESVAYSASRLLRQKEKRKILFVLSDGLPGPINFEHRAIDKHHAYLHDVVKQAREQIEVIGIGIATDAPRVFYKPAFVHVPDAQSLPSVVLQQLTQLLLR